MTDKPAKPDLAAIRAAAAASLDLHALANAPMSVTRRATQLFDTAPQGTCHGCRKTKRLREDDRGWWCRSCHAGLWPEVTP